MKNHIQKNKIHGKDHVDDGTASWGTAMLQNTPEENKVSDLVIPNAFTSNKKCRGGRWCIF